MDGLYILRQRLTLNEETLNLFPVENRGELDGVVWLHSAVTEWLGSHPSIRELMV